MGLLIQPWRATPLYNRFQV